MSKGSSSPISSISDFGVPPFPIVSPIVSKIAQQAQQYEGAAALKESIGNSSGASEDRIIARALRSLYMGALESEAADALNNPGLVMVRKEAVINAYMDDLSIRGLAT